MLLKKGIIKKKKILEIILVWKLEIYDMGKGGAT